MLFPFPIYLVHVFMYCSLFESIFPVMCFKLACCRSNTYAMLSKPGRWLIWLRAGFDMFKAPYSLWKQATELVMQS